LRVVQNGTELSDLVFAELNAYKRLDWVIRPYALHPTMCSFSQFAAKFEFYCGRCQLLFVTCWHPDICAVQFSAFVTYTTLIVCYSHEIKCVLMMHTQEIIIDLLSFIA
jgi:hypothetical protein